MPYLTLETSPKEKTSGDSIAPGTIKMRHFSSEVFLESQLIKLHNHLGTNSLRLGRNAYPDAVAGFYPYERVEHANSEWTGSASAAGSLAITFGNTFKNAPTVVANVISATGADFLVSIGSVTTTGFTVYWEDIVPANHTSVTISWLAIGK